MRSAVINHIVSRRLGRRVVVARKVMAVCVHMGSGALPRHPGRAVRHTAAPVGCRAREWLVCHSSASAAVPCRTAASTVISARMNPSRIHGRTFQVESPVCRGSWPCAADDTNSLFPVGAERRQDGRRLPAGRGRVDRTPATWKERAGSCSGPSGSSWRRAGHCAAPT